MVSNVLLKVIVISEIPNGLSCEQFVHKRLYCIVTYRSKGPVVIEFPIASQYHVLNLHYIHVNSIKLPV